MWAGKALEQRRHTRSACGGTDRLAVEVKLTGRENDGDVVGVMLRPQRPQKREFWGSGVEHRGHGKFEAASPGLTSVKLLPPQRPQNLTPSAKRAPHCSQATIPGKMLESLALESCDGDGWLLVPRLGFSCACMSCSPAPSRTSIRRSSARSPRSSRIPKSIPYGSGSQRNKPRTPTSDCAHSIRRTPPARSVPAR